MSAVWFRLLLALCVFVHITFSVRRGVSSGDFDYKCGIAGDDMNNTRHLVCCCHRNATYRRWSGIFIDCSGRGLNATPTQLPRNAIFLDLSHNNINGRHLIDDQPFEQFSNLTVLYLDYNNITRIENQSFHNLENLRYLDITSIGVRYDTESITPTAFSQLRNLENLRMKQNFPNFTKFERYPDKALSELKQLDTLHIDAMPNIPFGEGFLELRKLIYLIVSDDCCKSRCNVPQIDPQMFFNTPHLHYIGISVCNVKQIMYNAFATLHNLTRLNLNWNDKLTFKCMYNLTSGLRYTKIDKLWIIGLHDYYSDCNTLTADHLRFLSQTNITHLVMGGNRISGFTMNAIRYIPRTLKYISLADNMFLYGDYVKAIFNQNRLPNLTKLILSNQFESKVPGNLPPYNAAERKRRKRYSNNTFVKFATVERRKRVNNNFDIQRKDRILKSMPNSSEIAGYSAYDWFGVKRTHRSAGRWTRGFNSGCPRTTSCLHLPAFLNILNLSNMRMRMPLKSYNLTTQPNQLRKLYMNRNMFLKWRGPIIGFNALEILDLSENGCDLVTEEFFSDMPNLKYLNMSYNYLGKSLSDDKNGMTFYWLKQLNIIDLTNNKITTLPKKIFSGLENLKHLKLNYNQLIKFDIDLDHMELLNVINLAGNVINSLPMSITNYLDKRAMNTNITVSLLDNNLKCDCDQRGFLQWMLDTDVILQNMSAYTCTDRYQAKYRLTRDELRSNILPMLRRKCYNYTLVYIISSVCITLVLGSVAVTALYRNRYRVYYVYYSLKFRLLCKKTRQGYEQLYMKEVNVSYANTDADIRFVAEDIKHELENTGRLSLYVEDRDGELGVYQSENIIQGIMSSRKTLIILTKDYAHQNYCRFILCMLRETAISRNSKLMYFLLKGISVDTLPRVCGGPLHLEILDMMRNKDYADVIEYPPDDNDLPMFWDSVRASLQ